VKGSPKSDLQLNSPKTNLRIFESLSLQNPEICESVMAHVHVYVDSIVSLGYNFVDSIVSAHGGDQT